jgi:superoxide reductase
MENKMIFKCSDCAHVVEVLFAGPGASEMQCNGKPMKLMDEKNREGAGEKHLPVVEEKDGGFFVKVGSAPHPMEAAHWIQFVEVTLKGGYTVRKDLNPGEKPEAFFNMPFSEVLSVRELCSVHGLWAK